MRAQGPPHAPRTRRLGCLGRIVLLFFLGTVTIAAIDAVFAPWAFFLGGRTHVLPVWQGIGRIHASSGDYVLYFWISPVPGGRTFNLPSFRGWGELCTPTGERLQLRVNGGFRERTGVNTDGKAMRVELYRRPWYFRWTGVWDRRPRLNFVGRWQNQDLVLDDGGSVSQAFLPDGRLYQGPASNQPTRGQRVQLVLHETGWSGWFRGCRATV